MTQIDQSALNQLELALQLRAQGQLDEAIFQIKKVLNDYPEFAAAYNNLAGIYFLQKKWPEAMQCYQSAIAIQPAYVDAYYNLGLTYKNMHQHDMAEIAYQSVLRLNAEHAPAQFHLGCYQMQRKQFKKAISYFEGVRSIDSNHYETIINLANCYLNLGDLKLSKAFYLEAAKQNVQDEVLFFNLGVVHLQLGDLEAAIHFYQKALEVKQNYFEARNNLAVALLAQQKREQALKHFILASQLAPDNQTIQYMIQSLSGDQQAKTAPLAYIETLFDAYADHYEAHLLQSLSYKVPEQLIALLSTHHKMEAHSQCVLDLGCGTGLGSEKLRPYAKRLDGVDISANMVALAEKKQAYDRLFCMANDAYLIQAEIKYDLVFAADVLVYQGDLSELFRLVATVLKPGGLFLFSVESTAEAAYTHLQSGRFAHSEVYLRQAADTVNLEIVAMQQAVVRRENDEDVLGILCLLSYNPKSA